MHRNLLIFFGALLLVLATVFCLRMTGAPPAGADGALVVRVYPVPAALGTGIRDSLRTIMFATKDGVQPLGHASLTRPGQLVVSAPEPMHESIASAIEVLSRDELASDADGESNLDETVAFEFWVVGVGDEAGTDDPKLAPASEVLLQARAAMALGRFSLLQRAAAVSGGDGDRIVINTETLNANVQLSGAADHGVTARIGVTVKTVFPDSTWSDVHFSSALPLRYGDWHVVALASGQTASGNDQSLQLLLVRASRIAKGAPAAQQSQR